MIADEYKTVSTLSLPISVSSVYTEYDNSTYMQISAYFLTYTVVVCTYIYTENRTLTTQRERVYIILCVQQSIFFACHARLVLGVSHRKLCLFCFFYFIIWKLSLSLSVCSVCVLLHLQNSIFSHRFYIYKMIREYFK